MPFSPGIASAVMRASWLRASICWAISRGIDGIDDRPYR